MEPEEIRSLHFCFRNIVTRLCVERSFAPPITNDDLLKLAHELVEQPKTERERNLVVQASAKRIIEILEKHEQQRGERHELPGNNTKTV